MTEYKLVSITKNAKPGQKIVALLMNKKTRRLEVMTLKQN